MRVVLLLLWTVGLTAACPECIQVCEALLALPQSGKQGLDDKQREITERLHELAIEETRPDANIRLGMSRAMADTGKLLISFPASLPRCNRD